MSSPVQLIPVRVNNPQVSQRQKWTQQNIALKFGCIAALASVILGNQSMTPPKHENSMNGVARVIRSIISEDPKKCVQTILGIGMLPEAFETAKLIGWDNMFNSAIVALGSLFIWNLNQH